MSELGLDDSDLATRLEAAEARIAELEGDCGFGEGEAGCRGARMFCERIGKSLIETRDPQLVNSGAKLFAEAVRFRRLERDLKKDRLEAAEVQRLEEMATRISNVRGAH